MKILQICNKPPYPSNDGGMLAMHMLSEGLIKLGHQVKILSISTPKHPFREKDLPKDYINSFQPETKFINTLATPRGALFSLFSKESYHINRFYSEEFNQLIVQTLEKERYDCVLLESLFVFPYIKTIKKFHNNTIVYRAHNIEYQLWNKRLKKINNPLKKWLLASMIKKLTHFEREQFNQVDGIATITQSDTEEVMKYSTSPTVHIPYGISPVSPPTASNSTIPSLFYIGALDWEPNIEGLKWFLDIVWPKIIEKEPCTQFVIAGRNPVKWFDSINKKGVKYIGEVDDALQFMKQHSIMINPLFSGGGMRVKVIEGMALSKAIASTSIGVDGIPVSHRKEVMIADDADSFAKNVLQLIADKNLLNNIAKAGYSFIERNYSPDVICARLSDFLNELDKK